MFSKYIYLFNVLSEIISCFFISRNMAINYVQADDEEAPTLEHSLNLLMLIENTITNQSKPALTNKDINWESV